MFHMGNIILALDLGSARVHHGHQGHAPEHALTADLTQLAEHVIVRRRAEIDVQRDTVGADLQGFLHRADQYLAVGIG